jgi:sporulation protein YlmC with PRC-barrel domain
VNYDPQYENDIPVTDVDDRRGESRRVLSAGAMKGKRVRNHAGQDLGKIEEIVLDLETGRIAYAVLAFGGVIGIGEKLFAIPWRALTFDERGDVFIDADRRHFEQSPGFDPNHWPEAADPAWEAHLDEVGESRAQSRR